MKLKAKTLIAAVALLPSWTATAQQVQGFVHEQSGADGYEWPTDTAVLRKLDHWQDQKFGVLIHYGLYSIPGIVESWSICSEDVDWISRKENLPYDDYKKWYWGLSEKFNPTEFDPAKWAAIMKDAGMRYVLFTTKHHDGYCLFDSKLTDFTVANGPFGNDPRRDIAKGVINAFRDKGLMAGFYFSKPDWHCQWFWNPEFATPNRHINYKKDRHPEWWDNYVAFTKGQLGELLGGDYGKLDILWLDGGWITGDQVELDDVLAEARAGLHPGLIAVDRSIRGRNENYQTPERGIPEKQLDYPWESCIPLSNDWGWVPDAPYKSANKVMGQLAEITAKGGCLALGVGPSADGTIEDAVVARLAQMGDWLEANGEAIYSTRPVPVYNDGNVWFTGSKDGMTRYAIYALPEGEAMPAFIEWSGNLPKGSVRNVATGKALKHKVMPDGKVRVTLPKGLPAMPVALKFTPND